MVATTIIKGTQITRTGQNNMDFLKDIKKIIFVLISIVFILLVIVFFTLFSLALIPLLIIFFVFRKFLFKKIFFNQQNTWDKKNNPFKQETFIDVEYKKENEKEIK